MHGLSLPDAYNAVLSIFATRRSFLTWWPVGICFFLGGTRVAFKFGCFGFDNEQSDVRRNRPYSLNNATFSSNLVSIQYVRTLEMQSEHCSTVRVRYGRYLTVCSWESETSSVENFSLLGGHGNASKRIQRHYNAPKCIQRYHVTITKGIQMGIATRPMDAVR